MHRSLGGLSYPRRKTLIYRVRFLNANRMIRYKLAGPAPRHSSFGAGKRPVPANGYILPMSLFGSKTSRSISEYRIIIRPCLEMTLTLLARICR